MSSSSASIPAKGPDLAAAKKRSYLKRYGHPETADGWHFMTGTQPNIDALTKAVGLRLCQDSRPRRQADAVRPCQLAFRSLRRRASWRSTTWASSIRRKICGSGSSKPPPTTSARRSTTFLRTATTTIPTTNKHSLIVARVVQLGGATYSDSAGRFYVDHVPPRLPAGA